MEVAYRPDDGPWLRVVSAGEGTSHRILLALLRAGRRHGYEVRALPDGLPLAGSFETGPLREGLTGLTFQAGGKPTRRSSPWTSSR